MRRARHHTGLDAIPVYAPVKRDVSIIPHAIPDRRYVIGRGRPAHHPPWSFPGGKQARPAGCAQRSDSALNVIPRELQRPEGSLHVEVRDTAIAALPPLACGSLRKDFSPAAQLPNPLSFRAALAGCEKSWWNRNTPVWDSNRLGPATSVALPYVQTSDRQRYRFAASLAPEMTMGSR